MPTGSAALPWWVDALLILVAVVILATEIVRNFGAGRNSHSAAVDQDSTE